jgi:hypothetical protein
VNTYALHPKNSNYIFVSAALRNRGRAFILRENERGKLQAIINIARGIDKSLNKSIKNTGKKFLKFGLGATAEITFNFSRDVLD